MAEDAVAANICAGLRRCREKRGITIRDAAKGLGISERTLGDYERGEHEMRVEDLIRTAEYYRSTVHELIDFDRSKELAGRLRAGKKRT